MTVRLVCPLCGVAVADGPAPAPGTCPGCGARYAGDGESAGAAVAAAMGAWDVAELDPDALTDALFRLDPAAGPGLGVAITSDRREGDFYRWWLFARAGDDDLPALLAGLL